MSRITGVLVAALLVGLCGSAGIEASAAQPPGVPILVYHRFGPLLADDMTVRTSVLESQLALIDQDGYRVLPLKGLLAALGDSNANLPAHSVVLTIDDGHRSVFTDLYPLILKHRLQVTLFVYPSAVSNAPYALTWEQLAEMKASGLVDVQSHTFWHPNFDVERKRLSPEAYERFARDQFAKSKTILERRLGGPVDLLAWPFGVHNEQLAQWAGQIGYRAAFTIERHTVSRTDDMMALPRYIVVDADREARFEALLAGRR